MKKILTLLVFKFLLISCASSGSYKELSARAMYGIKDKRIKKYARGSKKVPVYMSSKVTEDGDYFYGGYLDIAISK